jgi:hypothetical protein
MADYSHLTVEQRAKVGVLFAEAKSINTTHMRFCTIFLTLWAPTRNTILCSFRKFEEEGSVKEEKHLCPPTVRSLEAVEAQP